MSFEQIIAQALPTLQRGLVIDRVEEEFIVSYQEEGQSACIRCELLMTCDTRALSIAVGDSVLIWTQPGSKADGIIIGRIGQGRDAIAAPDRDEIPSEVVLEASHCLTLRVGEGSITIREDGKILIQGKDLVSHAQRMNRIKGGAVSIN